MASGLHYEEIQKTCNSFLSKPASRDPIALLSSPVLYFTFEMAAARLKLLLDLPITQLSKTGVPSLDFYMLSPCLPTLHVWSPFLRPALLSKPLTDAIKMSSLLHYLLPPKLLPERSCQPEPPAHVLVYLPSTLTLSAN